MRISMIKSKACKSQNGSILIVILAVMMIAGIFITFGIDFMKLETSEDKRLKTQKDMAFIASQLESLIQRSNTLPCPSLPQYDYANVNYGWSTQGPLHNRCLNNNNGLLPVRNLGIPDEYMKDAWGHYYTYAISPAFHPPDNVSNEVFQTCRTSNWITNDGATTYNTNIVKARFCCPGIDKFLPSTDISVDDVSGVTYPRSADAADYSDANGPSLGTTLPNANNGEAVAFILISHGIDGGGAYMAGQAARDLTGLVGPQLENTNNDNKFVNRYMNLKSGDTYYDDMVLYKTQYQVMADLGSGSCTSAYYPYTISSVGSCPLPWGGTLLNGASVTAYQSASASPCVSETRTCTNGTLDGIGYAFQSCTASGPGYMCGTANENGTVSITAPVGKVFTSVMFSSYGLPNGSCGSFTVDSSCNANSSLVTTTFIGNNSGSIPAENYIFGDPCSETVKRLYIQLQHN